MDLIDSYKTIAKPSEGELFKDKNSKFYGYAFPVSNEDQIKTHLEAIKKEHYAARHWCYAYQLGTEKQRYRVNDDGEPGNSAGMPIYGQIQSYQLTNILIIVVRYYGGTKLGMGGLINAYRTGANLALEAAEIIERTIDSRFQLQFEYKHMSKVMRMLKEQRVEIINQKLEHNCLLEISVSKGTSSKVLELFRDFFAVKIDEL